jgi:hypothetical protein
MGPEVAPCCYTRRAILDVIIGDLLLLFLADARNLIECQNERSGSEPILVYLVLYTWEQAAKVRWNTLDPSHHAECWRANAGAVHYLATLASARNNVY